MNGTFMQFTGILLLASVLAFSASRLAPIKVEKSSCVPNSLRQGEICLATIHEKWGDDVIWIDARSQEDWRRDGKPGSFWVTHDQFDASLANVAPRLIEGKAVIVYCSAVGCNTSIEVAERIRSFQLATEIHALHGGWKTLQEAGLIPTK